MFGNSRVEAEGTGLGGITLQDMKIRAVVLLGVATVAAAIRAIPLLDTFGLGIYPTTLLRMNLLIIFYSLDHWRVSLSSRAAAILSLTSKGMKMLLMPWERFKVFLLLATRLESSLQRRSVLPTFYCLLLFQMIICVCICIYPRSWVQFI